MIYEDMKNKIERIDELRSQNEYFSQVENMISITRIKAQYKDGEKVSSFEFYEDGQNTGIICKKLIKSFDLIVVLKTLAKAEKEKNFTEIEELQK